MRNNGCKAWVTVTIKNSRITYHIDMSYMYIIPSTYDLFGEINIMTIFFTTCLLSNPKSLTMQQGIGFKPDMYRQ